MSEITKPHIVVKDASPAEQERVLRLVVDWMAQQVVRERALAEQTYRKQTDRLVADALRCMEGEVSLDKAPRGVGGQVLYLIDNATAGGYFAAWGDMTTPAPTDPGSGPLFGTTDHNLLDGDIHPDTVVQGATKGSLVVGNSTPKWDELAVGTNGHVLTADSAQTLGVKWAAVVTGLTTREVLIPAADFADISAAALGMAKVGTEPDAYMQWPFDSVLTNYVQTFWEVPLDYASGSVTVKFIWATDGAVALNAVPQVETLDVTDGADFTAAGAALTQTVSTNTAANLRITTTMGSFSPVAAGRIHRIVAGRDPGHASDTSTATVRFVGLVLSYTSSI